MLVVEKWKKYGNVVSYRLGGFWHVELFGFDVIHDAFVKHSEEFSGRLQLPGSEFARNNPGQKVCPRNGDLTVLF